MAWAKTVLVVVPARGGSQRVALKNIARLHRNRIANRFFSERILEPALLPSDDIGAIFATTEGAQGISFDELKPGVYKFVFEKTGFKKVTREKVVIKTDETFQIQIEMIEMGDYEILPSPFNISGF